MTLLEDYVRGKVDTNSLPPSLRDFSRWPEADRRALAQRLGVGPSETFREYITRVTRGRYKFYPMMEPVIDVLQRVVDEELRRVIIMMPPRHGKTELVSRLLPAYFLSRHPDKFAALTSYGASLAYPLSRDARNNYVEGGGELADDSASVKFWHTARGGGLWATGVGGPATGLGFQLGLIDDPVKDAKEAESEIVQQGNNDWYDSVFSTREEPGGAQVVMATRWNEKDLLGYILSKEEDAPQHWHIVRFEAIKESEPGVWEGNEEDKPAFYDTCTWEPDPRKMGEPLIPKRYDRGDLERVEKRVGPYFWAALYQQRPAPRQGGMFKRDWFPVVKSLPEDYTEADDFAVVRYWDKAGTEGDGAYTAGVLLMRAYGLFYVVDVKMGQWDATKRESIIYKTALEDNATFGGHLVTWVEQEPGSGGKESAQNTVRRLQGFRVKTDRPTGNKVLRADPVASQAGAGLFRMLIGVWNGPFLNVVATFPTGKYKDVVDALSGAFAALTRPTGKMKVENYA